MPLARRTSIALAAITLASLAGLQVAGEEQAFAASEPRPSARLDFRTDADVSGCKGAAAFRARVATRLGYDPFVDDASMHVRVRFVSKGVRVVARIDIEEAGQATGTRQLEEASSRCEPLSEAAAAAVAMAIDPVGRPPEPQAALPESAEAAREPAAPPVASGDRTTPPATPPAPSTRLAMTLDGVATGGLAPGLTMGAQAGVGARRGSLQVSAEGRIDTSVSPARVSNTDRVTSTAYSAALVPCALVKPLAVCLGVRFGSLETRGADVSSPSVRGSLLAMALARVTVRVPLTPELAVGVGAEVALSIVRTTLSFDGRSVWTAPPIHGSLLIGINWSAP